MVATFETLLPSGGEVYVSSTWVWVSLWVPQPVERTGNDARWPLRLVTKGYEAPSLFAGTFVLWALNHRIRTLITSRLPSWRRPHVDTLLDSPSWACPSPILGQVPDMRLKKPCRKWILLSYYFSHTFESPHSLWGHQSWGPRHHWAETSNLSVMC